jgi:3-hydroxy-9,10-secoandrosta-1,3,5(10)-triene-9,17-dione monooxygenase reductase component
MTIVTTGADLSSGTGRTPAAEALRRVLRQVTEPVVVVTGTSPAGTAIGMTVSSFAVASLAPPLLLVCPRVESRTWADLALAGSFAVNLLSRRQTELARRFASGGERFSGVRTVRACDGTPLLADSLAALHCDVHDTMTAGDHVVVLGRIRELHAWRDGPGLDTVTLRRATRGRRA